MDVREAISLFNKNLDMVVSVRESHAAALICKENKSGYLQFTLAKRLCSRQHLNKYVMPDEHSIDIDTEIEWQFSEWLL